MGLKPIAFLFAYIQFLALIYNIMSDELIFLLCSNLGVITSGTPAKFKKRFGTLLEFEEHFGTPAKFKEHFGMLLPLLVLSQTSPCVISCVFLCLTWFCTRRRRARDVYI